MSKNGRNVLTKTSETFLVQKDIIVSTVAEY